MKSESVPFTVLATMMFLVITFNSTPSDTAIPDPFQLPHSPPESEALQDLAKWVVQSRPALPTQSSKPAFPTQSSVVAFRVSTDHAINPATAYDVQAFEMSERARTARVIETLATGSRLKPLSLREIQTELLEPEVLLLEFSLGEKQSFLWLVSSTSISAHALPPRQVIELAAKTVYDLLAKSYRRDAKVPLDLALSNLGEMLLGPVANRLQRQKLVIVADGALSLVPFAALPVKAGYGGPIPLLVQHEIVSLPSASALAFLRSRANEEAPPSKLLAIVADPVFSAADTRVSRGAIVTQNAAFASLPRLPYTSHEAQAILSLAGTGGTFSALGFAANHAAVLDGRLRGYRFLHFATHGVVDPERPELSGLLLSAFDKAGRPRDPLLRTSEIDHLDLTSDLVVLSSCSIETEGTPPLSQHFLRAGAARVLVSRWNVNDRATADFMTRFYSHLLEERLSPAAALRKAQAAMRRNAPWGSPYYWAGFDLQGDWR